MIAKALTEVISFNKAREVKCREGDLLLIKVVDFVCIAYGWAGYFPVRKDELEFQDMDVNKLIQAIEETETKYSILNKKDAFPVCFVQGIVEREGFKEEFLKELNKSKISANLKNKLSEI